MLEALIGQKVVVDLRSPFVCLGTLERFDDQHLELRDADLHDLRDTTTTRESYLVESRTSGIKENRRRVLLTRSEVIAVSLLKDIIV
jgi:small nuclear ribonucleoprotein (snRNP)-like protein